MLLPPRTASVLIAPIASSVSSRNPAYDPSVIPQSHSLPAQESNRLTTPLSSISAFDPELAKACHDFASFPSLLRLTSTVKTTNESTSTSDTEPVAAPWPCDCDGDDDDDDVDDTRSYGGDSCIPSDDELDSFDAEQYLDDSYDILMEGTEAERAEAEKTRKREIRQQAASGGDRAPKQSKTERHKVLQDAVNSNEIISFTATTFTCFCCRQKPYQLTGSSVDSPYRLANFRQHMSKHQEGKIAGIKSRGSARGQAIAVGTAILTGGFLLMRCNAGKHPLQFRIHTAALLK
jgi:hypothetical protein